MVVESEGYHALIEYFTEHLSLFEKSETEACNETVEDVVTDMIATNLMAVFSQNPDLEPDFRFRLMQEADAVMEDLNEVLAGALMRSPTNEQVMFLEDYIGLVKNLFDSAISQHVQ
ncbi:MULTISPECIES: DUF3802 family protein [Photobacterium]|uniref:Topoisomerase II n=1 Tax=Photobacterium ganghwense TaxID=320778 RepID=A0A0J1HAA6_9GAMM|nr:MULTISPECIES: DUF3802 family protein [Photobacterium]KLV08614.1 topoisomerase II [Photobacterium ganghwense]MBV1839050.1 DUF3802 family protein [Photobacterium ganghwense]PSU10730.1 DUF3802 domain-containing protein [Photobacterium ganghwense]QSV12874.1 DUF3802 family protein [Photobacterium ganghwense]